MLHHHSGGGGSQNVATVPGAMAASAFSLFFPPPPSKGQWPLSEEAAYSYDEAHSTVTTTTTSPSSPASSSSAGSVDCTLSLGTPSSRRRATEPDMTMHGAPRQSAAALPWDAPVAESCYYQQQGRHVASRCAAGHEQLLDRRCANCGTSSTPLWRNGPRGPKSLCNACGIRFKKEERRAAETGAGGCGFYGAHGSPSAPIKVTRAPYAGEAQPCGGDPDAPFLAWRLSAVPPAPAFSVWPERQQAGLYQYN